jgi:DMSO/TMAO reductase YedYZ molybdopterin-dependent catalytic subunit
MAATTSARPTGTRSLARLAGVAAAGVALGVGELLSATGSHGQSLVGSVGSEVIDQAPGPLVRTGIDSLGTADKPVLVTTIVIVCLALGALVGPAARRRPWIGPVAFGAGALAGLLAGFRDPLADHAVVVLAAVSAAVAGSVTLALLLRRLPAERTAVPEAAGVLARPGRGVADRRAFLTWTGTAGAVGVLAAVGGRALAGRSTTADAPAATVVLPEPTVTLPGATSATVVPPAGLAVDGLTPLITPNADFYRIDTALTIPHPALDGWRLRIDGEVDSPFALSFDELMALPQVEAPVTIACVSNKVGGDLVGTAVWQGVPLSALLERAGVRSGGEQVVGRSLDGFTVGFPTAAAHDGRTALVAVGMNGEPLPREHGFPARLIVEGLYGYVSATKWLSSIELRGWDFDGYWIPLGWAKEGPIKTQSRIDVPRSGAGIDPGQVAVAGVAWAPGRGISAVEVQVDDDDWRPAQLGPEISDGTWRQWVWQWEASSGSHTLRVRATDGTGEVQTAEVAPPDPDGATGWHTRKVTVRG